MTVKVTRQLPKPPRPTYTIAVGLNPVLELTEDEAGILRDELNRLLPRKPEQTAERAHIGTAAWIQPLKYHSGNGRPGEGLHAYTSSHDGYPPHRHERREDNATGGHYWIVRADDGSSYARRLC